MVPIFFLFFFIKIISFLLSMLKQSSGFLWHFAPKVNIRCTWWWLCLPRYFNDLKGHFEICRLYKIQNYVPFITWYFTSAKCVTSLGKRLKKRKRIHNWSFKFKASPLRALSIIDNCDFYLFLKMLQIFGLWTDLREKIHCESTMLKILLCNSSFVHIQFVRCLADFPSITL